MQNKIYKVVENGKKFFIFSGVLMAIILLFCIFGGVKMDIQFKGGALLNYGTATEMKAEDIEKVAKTVLGAGITVQSGTNSMTGDSSFTVSLPGSSTIEAATLEMLNAELDKAFPDQKIEQLEVTNVNPIIGKEFFAKSIVAVITAFILILVYIAIRFRKIGGWSAGSMAIVALIHDLIVIFGVFVIMGIPLNGNFIAAVLTILGYSINDTVVIYDRIRENRSLHGNKMGFVELVNTSISQSLKRSISTSVSTVIALSCVCVVAVVFDLNSIFTFAFPLVIGMISGVYSTICIAGPLWALWETKFTEKKQKN